MKKYILGAVLSLGILVSPAFVPRADATTLTALQSSIIIQLLQAFGIDQSTIATVQAALGGGTFSTGGATLTVNGQTSTTNVDPMLTRTWAWSGTPGAAYIASGVISGCDNSTQNGIVSNWTPWTGGSGTASSGSTSAVPGATKYGCTITGTYRVTSTSGQIGVATASITFKHSNSTIVPPGSELTITTSSLHPIQSDHNWGFTLAYTGGSGTPVWSLASGALPATMELDPVKGVISNYKVFNTYPSDVNNHIPEGTYTFVVKVTVGSLSATKQLSLEVRPLSDKRLIILQSSGSSDPSVPRRYIAINEYLIEIDYSIYFYYMPGTQNEERIVGDKCSFVSGQLPPGLSIGPSIRGCRLTGVPTTEGTYTFTFKIENEFGGDTMEWTLEAFKPEATIKPNVRDTLPTATVGEPYSFKVNPILEGNLTPQQIDQIRFGARGGMPPGITIDDRSGLISGTPTEAGTYIPSIYVGISTMAYLSHQINPTLVVKPRIQTPAQLNASIMTAWSDQPATSFKATMVQNGWTLGDVTTATGLKMSALVTQLYSSQLDGLYAMSAEAAKIIDTFDWSEANKHQSALSFRTIMIQKGITLDGAVWGYYSLSGWGAARNEIRAVVIANPI